MNIAVVEDERVIREHLCGLIEKLHPQLHVESYAAGEALLASEGWFDIVFLDIQMEGISGIETARRLRERQEEVVLIFITGLREYVFEALDLYAFQYLLKPVEERKFAEVLARAVKEAGQKKKRRELFIKARNLTLDPDEICYIESRGKKVEINMAGTRDDIVIYASMDELERQLGEEFYRCHRAYLVNMAYMWHLQNGGAFRV